MLEECGNSHTPDWSVQSCGQFDDDPVVRNGVNRVYHFYRCIDTRVVRESCETGPGAIRGEFLCAEFTMEEHHLHVTCTCWKRDGPNSSNNNKGYWKYRRQTEPKRAYTAIDGQTVYLGQDYRYVDSSGTPVDLRGHT
jgi:hypothetical protein